VTPRPRRYPLISVVIPTHQRASLLDRALHSLAEQTLPRSSFEVVVVDDGSTDETGQVCERLGEELRLNYFWIENSGISAAKNLGLFASQARLVLFFDDDDLADPRLLEEHLEAHRAHPEENVAVLGYTTWAPELELTPLMEYVTEIGQQLFFYRSIEDGAMLDHTYFWGGRSSCKRSFLVHHGSFDQALPAMEDIELGYRLSKHGLVVRYAHAAQSFMVRAVTYDEFARRCVKRGRALWLFNQRHSEAGVQRYCRVDEALDSWPTWAPSLGEKMDRVRELERRHSQEGGLEEDALGELRELYGWTFEALQARGIAEAAMEASARTPARSDEPAPIEVNSAGAASANGASRHEGGAADEVIPPVVIFGAPRSGTTYVNGILNAHPRVHITNETRLFVWAHRALSSLEHPQIALTEREDFEEYLRPRLAALLRDYYRKRWPDAVVWGDKNPHYAAPAHEGVLEMVSDLFPGAKFIHVIRDGRDVVASLIRKRHPDGRPWVSFEDAHYAWNSHIITGHEFATRAAPGTVLEVRYEDLIANDLGMARKMCEFVGIDCHPRIVEFCERQSGERTPMSGPTRDLSHGVEHSDWEDVLSAQERRDESLGLLRENLLRFGYPV
jgi:GT2 family glycosyltransferase